MLKHRVIPLLLLQHGGLVKTRRFKRPQYVGDPINAVHIFNEKEVDELIVLDIATSKRGTSPDYRMIELFAAECFMPLCYGGGIRTLDQASQVFALGVEKICLQSAVLESPRLITEVSDRFGAQSVVVSADIKRDWLRRPRLYQSRSGRLLKTEWLAYLRRSVDAGAGELVLNSVDRDGEMVGYDLTIIQQAAQAVSVPVIAAGGAGTLEDFREAVAAGASAVAAGAMFVYQGPHRAVLISYPPYSKLIRLFEENNGN